MSKWSSRTSDQFIWLVSKKKTEAVNAYLIKNSKEEGGGEEETNKKTKLGEGVCRKDWAERDWIADWIGIGWFIVWATVFLLTMRKKRKRQ